MLERLAAIYTLLIGPERVERAHTAAVKLDIAATNLGCAADDFGAALRRFAERSENVS